MAGEAQALLEKDGNSSPVAAFDGFNSLSLLRQIGIMIGFAASVAIGIWVVLWSQEPSYKPLYNEVSNLDAIQISEILTQEDIAYKIDTEKGVLMVDSSRVHDARLALAGAGLPNSPGVGYELLDKDSKLGTSQFMERARYHRSLEGELSKTIMSLSPVRAARVHLAIPRQTVFVGDGREPSASVFVDLYPGRSLEKHQVAAIVNMVASSIPELSEKKVTVIDHKGNLLSDTDQDSDIGMASKQLDYTKSIEKKFIDRVNRILEPIIGREHFRVEVSTDVDFTKSEKTAESYNPDLPSLRSEQVMKENFGAGANGFGIPGALSNQPPGAAAVPEVAGEGEATNTEATDNGNSRAQATRNYELDKTISYTKHQFGVVRKLSVAVVVDDKISRVVEDGKAKEVRTPLNANEIERLTVLVKEAVGYNAIRGDSVTVINQPFIDESIEMEIPEKPFYEHPLIEKWGGSAIAVLFLLVMLLGVMRPLLKSLAASSSDLSLPDDIEGIEMAPDEDELSEMVTLSGGPESLLPGPEEGYEEQISAVKGMIAEDPRRVAQVIKTWLNNE